MNHIKKISFFFIAWLIFSELSAATLHTVIVADTDNLNGGASFQTDLTKIIRLVKDISQSTNLTLNFKEVSGNEFAIEEIKSTIEKLSIQSQDVVIFYYTGHGGRNPDKNSLWPSMDIRGKQLDVDWVKLTLKNKNPRFLVILADTCNNFDDSFSIQEEIFDSPRSIQSKNYSHLFLNYTGHIFAIAAKPEQYAWGNTQYGGFFTNTFLNSLNKELAFSTNPSWHNIMQQVGTTIQIKDKIVQNPLYRIDITPIKNNLSLQILPSKDFKVGQNMEIKVTNQSQQAGYVFVWDISSNGKIVRVLPNNFSKKHYLDIQQSIQIPENGFSSFVLTMVEPLGKGIIAAMLVNDNSMQTILNENFNLVNPTNAQNSLQQMSQKIMQLLGTTNTFITIDYNISD